MYGEKESEVANVIRKEITSGFFIRIINVGQNSKEEDIKAELVNGLLKLTAHKIKPKGSEVCKIEIS